MARHRRQSRWMTQAALQALVRFGPEESGLKAARRDAESAYKTTVRQADATSAGIQYAIGKVRPKVPRNYDAAGLQAARAAHVADGLSAPGVPDSMKAAIAAERAGFTSETGRVARAGADGARGPPGAGGGGRGVREDERAERARVDVDEAVQRHQDLAGERGAFTVATAQQLKQAAQDRADTLANQQAGRHQQNLSRGQSERNSLRSAGIDPDTGKPIPNGKLDPKAKTGPGAKPKTQDEINRIGAASDEIDRLRGEIKNFPGAKPSEIRALLLAGDKGSAGTPLHDPATGKPLYNKDGTPKTGKPRPALTPAKSRLLLDIALDLQTKHYVSKENHQKLVRRGLRLRDLGLPSEGGYKQRQVAARKRRARARNKAAGGKLYGPAF
jgi:hypothetical protein